MTPIIERYRESMAKAGIKAASGMVRCPLCWVDQEVAALTDEHVIPGAVGGKITVLTCKKCNNTHGSTHDKHLVAFQKVADSFRGKGDGLKAALAVEGNVMRGNWSQGGKHFVVAGKATDPRAVDAFKEGFGKNEFEKLSLTMNLDFSRDGWQRAVIRASYLAMFCEGGFPYAASGPGAVARRMVAVEYSGPPKRSSVVFAARGEVDTPAWQYAITPVILNGVKVARVSLCIRRETASIVGCHLPIDETERERFAQAVQAHRDSSHGTFHLELFNENSIVVVADRAEDGSLPVDE